MKTFSISDIGKRREMNQDYMYTSENAVGNLPNLFIILFTLPSGGSGGPGSLRGIYGQQCNQTDISVHTVVTAFVPAGMLAGSICLGQ